MCFSNLCCDSICRWRSCSQSLLAETTQVCVLSSNLFPMLTWTAEFKVSWGKRELNICFARSRIFQVFNASRSCFSSIQTACWEVLCIYAMNLEDHQLFNVTGHSDSLVTTYLLTTQTHIQFLNTNIFNGSPSKNKSTCAVVLII